MSDSPGADPRAMLRSFTELQSAVGTLRSRGETASALDLVQRHVGMFAHHRALLDLITAELLAELGARTTPSRSWTGPSPRAAATGASG